MYLFILIVPNCSPSCTILLSGGLELSNINNFESNIPVLKRYLAVILLET